MADAAEIKDRAAEILSGPEYDRPEPGVVGRVLGWIGDRITDLLDRIADLLTIGPSGGSGGYLIGWVVLLAGAAALIWFLIRVVPRRRLARSRKAKPEVITARRERTTRAQWLAQAAAAESAGNFSLAVRCRYRALTAGLADHRELDPEESVTSGEHLRAFDPAEPRHGAFATATERYEYTWFGERPAGPPDADLLETIDQTLVVDRRRGESRAGAIGNDSEPGIG